MNYISCCKIAGKVIKISSLYEEVHSLCSEYATTEAPDFSVSISPEDVSFEREKSAREDRLEGHDIRHFSDAYLETLAVYRKIAAKLLDDDILLFHGSAIAVDGVGYLFTAKSNRQKHPHKALARDAW